MDGRGLAFPRHDQPFPAVRQQILRQGVDPARVNIGDARSRETRGSGFGRSKACSKRRDEGRDLSALETEPMIRHRSRQRVDPFNSVKSVHLATGGSRPSSGREASRVTDHLRVGEKRVGVEGENHRGSIEPEHEIEVAPRGVPQSRDPALVADGVIGRPLHLGVAGTDLGNQARQRRRRERLGQNRKAGAAVRGMSLGERPPGRHEIAP